MLVLALQNFARVVSFSLLNKLRFRYLRSSSWVELWSTRIFSNESQLYIYIDKVKYACSRESLLYFRSNLTCNVCNCYFYYECIFIIYFFLVHSMLLPFIHNLLLGWAELWMFNTTMLLPFIHNLLLGWAELWMFNTTMLLPFIHNLLLGWAELWMFNTTINDISSILWCSVLMLEETWVPWEAHQPDTRN